MELGPALSASMDLLEGGALRSRGPAQVTGPSHRKAGTAD
jgi:hypothetical protein